MDSHEPAAAYVAAAWFDDGKRIAHRNRRIDRVAAGHENAGADLGGNVLRGHDHAALRLDCDRRRGRGRAG